MLFDLLSVVKAGAHGSTSDHYDGGVIIAFAQNGSEVRLFVTSSPQIQNWVSSRR